MRLQGHVAQILQADDAQVVVVVEQLGDRQRHLLEQLPRPATNGSVGYSIAPACTASTSDGAPVEARSRR